MQSKNSSLVRAEHRSRRLVLPVTPPRELAVTRREPGNLSRTPKGYVLVRQEDVAASSTYITAKSRGAYPPPVELPKFRMPSMLQMTMSLILMVCFLAGASMFSIGLSSYSNSIDRVDERRSFNWID